MQSFRLFLNSIFSVHVKVTKPLVLIMFFKGKSPLAGGGLEPNKNFAMLSMMGTACNVGDWYIKRAERMARERHSEALVRRMRCAKRNA